MQLFHAQAKQASPNQIEQQGATSCSAAVGEVSEPHSATKQPLENVQPGFDDAKASKPVVHVTAATSTKTSLPKQQVLQAAMLLACLQKCAVVAYLLASHLARSSTHTCLGVFSLHLCF